MSYRYVGPADLLALINPAHTGRRIAAPADFDTWASARSTEELAEPFTYVVDTTGVLRLAARRSEHVVCAGGEDVLGAGEITFRNDVDGWTVAEVTNQSTGYCPDAACWPPVASALDRAGLPHPPGFTHEVVFRWCPKCDRLNVVRDEDYFCVFCDHPLPVTERR